MRVQATLLLTTVLGCRATATPEQPADLVSERPASTEHAEVSTVADLPPVQAPVALVSPSGRVVAALQNPGGIEQRVVLGERAAARLVSGGEPVGHRPVGPWPAGPTALSVVDTDEAYVRVAVGERPVALLLYVERHGIVPMLQRVVRLVPARLDVAGKTGIDLAPGAEFKITKRGDGWAHVELESRGGPVAGWIPQDTLGEVYTPTSIGNLPDPVALAMPGTRLNRARGKQPLYELPPTADKTAYTVEVREDAGAWVRVRFAEVCPGHLAVTGWVRARQLDRTPQPGGLGLCGIGGGGESAGLDDLASLPTEKVAKGRVLLAAPGGEVVGLVRKDTALPVDAAGLHYVATAWGPVPVVLAPPDVRLPSVEAG